MTFIDECYNNLDPSDNSFKKPNPKLVFKKGFIRIYNLRIAYLDLDKTPCLVITYGIKDILRIQK